MNIATFSVDGGRNLGAFVAHMWRLLTSPV